ncbi:hypothetical protein QUF70_06015 [Desulfobacterales bacterium HSG17]|nr:hypothetical protein [Desulfobacterales bacterium HSG17]
MGDLSERLKDFFDELTHIEVNTIIKPNMTGRKMPKPRHAIIEIAKKYRLKLVELGYPLADEENVKPGCYKSFDMIREKANEAIKNFEKKADQKHLSLEEEEELVMLFRIKSMSDQVKGIFNALKLRNIESWDNDFSHDEVEKIQMDLPLETGEIIMIRKIWEMGLEQIAMQTVVQLDGDVVTRIKPKYADENSRVIHNIHNQGVTISLNFWSELINIVKDFLHVFVKKKKT